MFYDNDIDYDEDRALVTLNSAESKRFIAMAVSVTDEVKAALKSGYIVIIGGTTNAFVAEEIIGLDIDKYWFASGRISQGELGANSGEKKLDPIVIKDGKVVDIPISKALEEFNSTDVYIKGANAVDTKGNAGVLMADDKGGTIGAALGILNARGANHLIPVGLEKLIPSVPQAIELTGQGRVSHSTGLKVGMMGIMSGKVITEIEAVKILFGDEGVKAVHVASGGVDSSVGAVTIGLIGPRQSVKRAFDFIVKIKGDNPINAES